MRLKKVLLGLSMCVGIVALASCHGTYRPIESSTSISNTSNVNSNTGTTSGIVISPEDLREVYDVYYLPETQYVNINYYTDDIDEANLIASTTWGIKVDDWEGTIQLPDTLPNELINKYKPVGCSGGEIVNPEAEYTFYDLVALDEIAILYETIVEPGDPTNLSYESKVLYWGLDGL